MRSFGFLAPSRRGTIAAAAFILALATARPLVAQTIQGLVVSADDEMPLGDADLALLDRDGVVRAAALSDGAGRFELRAPGPGSYAVHVVRLGYRSFTTDPVPIGAGEIVRLELRLGTRALPVAPVVITARSSPDSRLLAEFEARRNDPGQPGHFITREEIARRPVASVAQLLYGLPNVRVQQISADREGPFGPDRRLILFPNPRAPGSRDCVAHLFVDGVPVAQSPTSSIDDVVPPEILAGVEVYPRPAMVPLPYRSSDDCGAVLFWTRPGEDSGRGWSLKRIAIGVGGILAIVFIGAR